MHFNVECHSTRLIPNTYCTRQIDHEKSRDMKNAMNKLRTQEYCVNKTALNKSSLSCGINNQC
jgi:hypothetical protein